MEDEKTEEMSEMDKILRMTLEKQARKIGDLMLDLDLAHSQIELMKQEIELMKQEGEQKENNDE